MITGCSVATVRHVSSLGSQSSFSQVSCWSVVSKKTGSLRAMPAVSIITSIGFVEISSLIFRGPFPCEKKILHCSVSLEGVQC